MKKPKRVVWDAKGYPLLLEGIKWNEDATLKSGYVENGAWDFEIRAGECLAKNGNYIVNRWPNNSFTVTPVPDDMRGHYNEIIQWAREQA